MSNVLVDKNKIDILANAISVKSGEPVTMTLAEMVEAVDGIEVGGGTPTLETVTKTYTPSTSAVTDTITPSSGYDGIEEVDVTVSAVPLADYDVMYPSYTYATENNNRKFKIRSTVGVDFEGWIDEGNKYGNYITFNAIAKNTSVTPTTSAQTIGGANYMMEGAVTVNAIPTTNYTLDSQREFYTDNGARKWHYRPRIAPWDEGYAYFDGAYDTGSYVEFNAIATGTSVTPTESAQTIGGANTMLEGAVTVNAIPSNYVGSGITQRTSSDLSASGATVTAPSGYYASSATKTVASGTEGTPTATKGSVSNHSISVTPSVTNTAGYISGGTHNGTAVSVSASELVSGTYTVDSSGTKDVTNYASASIPSGTAGTPSASKGTVSNHAVTVTPSVTNTTGWITGSTKTGTGVSVSASELVSGNLAITNNGSNIDVTDYATVSVNVSGGGGSSMAVGSDAAYPSAYKSIMFTSMLGEPTSFYLMALGDIATSSTPKVAAVVYDGTNVLAQTITNTSNAQVSYNNNSITSHYSGVVFLISISEDITAVFDDNIEYQLVYTYGGSSANVGTADVQVGSGATSITFTGLEDEPTVWSCIFKSNFSTSSGYQRVIFVGLDDTSAITGLEMDSGAHVAQHWTASYNNGSLTITSNGTNQGGYFHQPGYYQLTYAIGDPSPYEKKSVTYRASTSAQTDKIEPSTGYDAMSEVNITIPAVSQTNLTAANIKSGTTVTISNGSTNLWSVTGTYTGGGGANIATATMTNSSNQNTSIDFTLPSGRTPIAFFARLTSQIARNSNSRYYYVFDMRWDGSSTGGVAGNTFYMYSGTLTNVTSGYSYSQSGTTFTLSSTGSRSASPGSFYNGNYELVYVY